MDPVTICATADLHLGQTFSSYTELQNELIEARFSALEKSVELASRENADLFIVAGDLFDRINVADRFVTRTVDILAGFTGACAAVLPGNHDYYLGPDTGVWKKISEKQPDRLLLLTDKISYDLSAYGLEAELWPGPCNAQYSRENSIGWIPDTGSGKREPATEQSSASPLRIGIAHGSIDTLSPDPEKHYFPMTLPELRGKAVDFWIVGHTHLPWPSDEKELSSVVLPGTPEPDGFDCSHQGSVWLLHAGSGGKLTGRREKTGTYRFRRVNAAVKTGGDLSALKEKLIREADSSILLDVILSGSLPSEDYQLLGETGEELRKLYPLARVNSGDVRREITEEDISREFQRDSFPWLLLSRLSAAGDSEALQTAYRLLREELQ